MRHAWLVRTLALALLVSACQGGDLTIFEQTTTTSAGAVGDAGEADASDAGDGGATGLAGASGSASSPGAAGSVASTDGGAAGDSGVGDSGAGDSGVSCGASSDCPAAWLCRKAACGKSPGKCEPRPVFCDADPAPVCACDHVTYWNDCLRQQSGQSASSAGECSDGVRVCYGNTDCPAGASCSHLLPPMSDCSQPGLGTCWVTPSACDSIADQRRWRPCGMLTQDASNGCVSTCLAIQSGRPQQPVPPNSLCQ